MSPDGCDLDELTVEACAEAAERFIDSVRDLDRRHCYVVQVIDMPVPVAAMVTVSATLPEAPTDGPVTMTVS